MLILNTLKYSFLLISIMSLIFNDKWILNFMSFFSLIYTFLIIVIFVGCILIKDLLEKYKEKEMEQLVKDLHKKDKFGTVIYLIISGICIYHGFIYTGCLLIAGLALSELFKSLAKDYIKDKYGEDYLNGNLRYHHD